MNPQQKLAAMDEMQLIVMRDEINSIVKTSAYRLFCDMRKEDLASARRFNEMSFDEAALKIGCLGVIDGTTEVTRPDLLAHAERIIADRKSEAVGMIKANRWAEYEGFGLLPFIEAAISQKSENKEQEHGKRS